MLTGLRVPGYRRGLTLTIAGAVLISVEGILIRLVQADMWTIVWWRGILLGLTIVAVLPIMFRTVRVRGLFGRAQGLAVVAFAGAVFCFVSAIQQTTVANTLVIASATPLVAAVLSWAFLGERVGRVTWFAVLGVFAGLAVIFGGSLQIGHAAGDLFALGYAVCAAGYYVALRPCREGHFLPLIALGGLLSAGLAWPQAAPLALSGEQVWLMVLLGVVVVPLATLLLSYGTRDLGAPEVTLLMMLETILGPSWAWLVLREAPSQATMVGGALVVTVILLHARRSVLAA